jgi:predicted nuclease of restriction endonuclease-like (RecB) superfamily
MKSALPRDYAILLNAIKKRVQREHIRIVRAANSSMIMLYWEIGTMILKRQRREGWGAKVIDRLAVDLRNAFPAMSSFSTRNLISMRNFADKYRDPEIVKQSVSQLPWGHLLRLLQLVKDASARRWYVHACIREGWGRATLEKQVKARAHLRHGKAVNNFVATLPRPSSDVASLAFKDPYLFDFLGTADPRREREVEQALVDHIQRLLLELGHRLCLCRAPGSSGVGRG